MALSEVSSDYCTGCASEFIDICHGYSPKFIQAAIEAVKEYDHNLDMQRFDVSWSTTAMFHAISLLPKGTT